MGIREREGKKHSRTKKNLVSILVDVANVGAERMSEKIGKASLRDAAIETGVGVDKMLALTGQTPTVQIANIVRPSEEERADRRAIHERRDAIARSLYGGSLRRPKRLPSRCVAHLISSSASTGVWYFVYWLEGEIIKL